MQRAHARNKKPTRIGGFFLVGLAGLEPATSRPPALRATNCATARRVSAGNSLHRACASAASKYHIICHFATDLAAFERYATIYKLSIRHLIHMRISPNSKGQFELPKLPYGYDALEAAIDASTMEIHYTKHHQGYVDKLNAALEGQTGLVGRSLGDILGNLKSVPEEIRTAVRNNGGGHYNHSLFWQVMSPDGGGEPNSPVKDAITQAFGSFDGARAGISGVEERPAHERCAFNVGEDFLVKILPEPRRGSHYGGAHAFQIVAVGAVIQRALDDVRIGS